MATQTLRQLARRDARSVAAKRRAELLKRAKRVEDLAVEVVTAIGERDAVIEATELRAGEALERMISVEGLAVAEAVEWCGIDAHAVRRLRRLAAHSESDEQPGVSGVGDSARPN
ncbi:hypothetical protein [Nocardioides zeicaulis]|uniref:Uncharacterized protein n=1 Tax=Nocardioides zeicaulis TaxID=1776857 RepID=A0ABV6DWM7_9ACTN